MICAPRFIEIHILSGSRRGHRQIYIDPQPLPLPAMPLRIGRHTTAGPDPAVLFDAAEAPTVSRRHVAIHDRGTHLVLTDEGSSCGTFLLPSTRGEPLLRLQGELPLHPGAAVRVMLGEGGPICRISVGQAVPFGHYMLVGRLGVGGMGEVFVARDTGMLQRFVVLKVIRRSVFQVAPDAEKLLLKEAGIVAKLASPHVVRVFEAAKHDQVLYIAMEHLPGVTLANLTAQFLQLQRRLPPAIAAALIRQALLGLHDAHELVDDTTGQSLGVVHLDVSPANLICTPRGEVKVIDFGVARARDQLSTHSAPNTARIVGNPPYMSPEQILSPQTVDRRADIFSAGVVLWELCAGQRLFNRANLMATLDAVRRAPVPGLQTLCPDAPQRLVLAVQQALCRDREGRQDSARDFAAQLEVALRDIDPRLVEPEHLARELHRYGADLTLGGAPEDPGLDLRPHPLDQVPEVIRHGPTDPNLLPLEVQPSSVPAPASASASVPASVSPPSEIPVPTTAINESSDADQAREPGSGPLVVEIPMAADKLHLRSPSGATIVVLAAPLGRLDAEPRPVPLPLPGGEAGPPLLAQLQGRRLQLTVSPEARTQKIEIYRGPPRADNGQPAITLPQTTMPGESFYFGYRRQQFQKVDYTCALGQGAAISLVVPVLDQQVRVHAPAGVTHLAVLCTADPGGRGVAHLVCLFVQD